MAGERQQAQQGHIIDFGAHGGFEAGVGQKEIEVGADVALAAGQEERDAGEERGEGGAAEFQFFGGNEEDGDFAEEVVEDIRFLVGAQRDVGEDKVEGVFLQLAGEFVERAGDDDQLEAGFGEEGLDEFELEVFGKRPDGAEAQDAPGGAAGLPKAGEQFLAGFKDGLGICEGHATGVGELQLAAGAVEERLAEPGFEFADLLAEGGLGNVKDLRGARHAAMAGDHPKMAEVVVVEPFEGQGRFVHRVRFNR